MPGTEAEAHAIADYIAAGFTWNGAAAAMPTTGQELYLAYCAACHGGDARGTNLGPGIRGDADDKQEMIEVSLYGEDDMPPIDVPRPQAGLIADYLHDAYAGSGGGGYDGDDD